MNYFPVKKNLGELFQNVVIIDEQLPT